MSVIHPPRRLLFGPGPSQVEPRVYQAMAQPMVGLLDHYFFEIVEEIRKDLRVLFGTQNPFVHVLSGTGSSGMESALANFVEPGQKLVVFSAGYFGERIAEMGRRQGANVFVCQKPWGETFTEAQAWEVLGREMPHAVAFVHAETSTGALQDPQAITAAAHGCGAITIMDCVTSLGAMPINIDASAVDVAFSCTQKGLSCPPGLSPITVSPAVVEKLRARKTPCPIWYLDLKLILDYYEAHRYHHTPPVSSFYALREGLAAIREEGAEKRFARHQRAHGEFVRRIEAINLSMFVPEPARRIPSLNTVRVPEGVDDVNTRKRLIAEFGIEIAGGFGPLAGKIFRIGLMGPLATEDNAAMFVGALVHCLRE
jgi:alanine-glyoxylate transaminase / serine-glyoxylate transaminase / serine-pyruvate transaminase